MESVIAKVESCVAFVPAFEGHLVIKSFTLEMAYPSWIQVLIVLVIAKEQEPKQSLTKHHGEMCFPFVNLQSDPSFSGSRHSRTPQGHQHKGDACSS